MILRKPYAFLIKHFRLIHLILAVLTRYSIYRTKIVLDFFNDYVIDMVNVIGQDLHSSLIPVFYTFAPILIIVLSLIIMLVLALKKKPNLFYFINILIYVFAIIIIAITASILDTMQISLVDVRTIRLIRDFIILTFITQFISLPIIIIRTTGFDIKKFNFKEDLDELEISEEDREEFEVELNVDKSRLTRNLRKKIRFLKYSYQENMLLYNIVASIILVVVIGYIGFGIITKAPRVGYNTYFSGNGFTMSILDSYLVNTDYKGKVIDEDYYYLLLKIKVKNNSNTPNSLETATMKILIDHYYYVPIIEYKDRFIDFGDIYSSEKIGNEYVEKTLLYQIPIELINDDMVFSYVNKNSYIDKEGFKSTKVAINYTDLTGVSSNEKIALGETLYLDESILSDFKVTITDYDISDRFKIKYNYCYSNECMESYQYLTPNLNTNYDKVLLKINGILEKTNNIDGVYDLYDFIDKFGKIRYDVNGELQVKNLSLNEVVSSKANEANVFYIEVPKEIENSTNISFVFTIRDRIYEYVLK